MEHNLTGIEDRALRERVLDQGSKIGILEHFRENNPRLRKLIVPRVVMAINDRVTNAIENEYMRATGDFEYSWLQYGRTSHPGDWFGLVDALPTIRSQGGKLGDLRDDIGEVSFSRDLDEFTKLENTAFNPEDIMVSFEPFSGTNLKATITEHPNQEGVVFVDLVEGYRNLSYVFKDGVCVEKEGRNYEEKIAKELYDLVTQVRETGSFSSEIALQLEAGFNEKTGKKWLYQVRAFAERVSADFKLEGEDGIASGFRCFGITDQNGATLPLASDGSMRFAFADSRHRFPTQPHAITFETMPSQEHGLRLSIHSGSLTGYFPTPTSSYQGHLSLGHHHTRGIQGVLKRGGVAIIDPTHFIHAFHERVHIISDGLNYRLKASGKRKDR